MREITAYHSSESTIVAPNRLLHVGTPAQARMRGGAHLHEVVIRPPLRMARLRDVGSWRAEAVIRHARRSPVVVYLNRYEGIPREAFERLADRGIDLDALPDSRFSKLVPEAEDSWIVLDPDAIASIRVVDWP
jgi:hypothetical protein